MTTDVTDQLRAGIERIPAHVPPGLARSAYRRYRRRRVTVRVIAAAGSAVAAGIAAAVLLPGPATPATQDAAYFVSHVTQALGALPSNTIFFDRMTWVHMRRGRAGDHRHGQRRPVCRLASRRGVLRPADDRRHRDG